MAITFTLLGLSISPFVFWLAGPNYTADFKLFPILVVLNTLISLKYAISSKILALGQQAVAASNVVWCGAVIFAVHLIDSKDARLIAPAYGHVFSLFFLLIILGRTKAITLKDAMFIFMVAATTLLSIFTCTKLL